MTLSPIEARPDHDGRDRLAIALGVLLIALAAQCYLIAYSHYFPVPTRASFDDGWWRWTDQGRYWREALAWAAGDLRPSEHWYLPLYSLIGAAMVPFDRVDPFRLPDLVCYVASGLLVMALARRLAPELKFAALWGAIAFCVADGTTHLRHIDGQFALKSWIEPWTTTPTAPLLLGLLLAALRLRERPGAGRAAVCGLLWGLILITRPTEAVWSSLPAIVFCAIAVLWARRPVRTRLGFAAAGIAPAAVLAAIGLGLHLMVWGWSWGQYFLESLGTGFEPRLLALRWNWLVLDARPIHERYHGLAVVFPWVLPGFAGMIAGLLAPRGNRPAHVLVAAAVMVHWAVYLCYRDLHAEGLWRFGNYHYFKWTQPLLCFYALLLVLRLARRGERLAGAGSIALVLLACCWQSRLERDPHAATVRVLGPGELAIPGGMTDPTQVLVVPARGDAMTMYVGPELLEQHGRVWAYNGDVKAWPLPGGMVLSVLRRLPAGDAVIRLAPGIEVAPDSPPYLARMRLSFGLPCAVLPKRASCRPALPRDAFTPR
ncbi:hypothetical protein FHR90_001361 [Endobacter medicaginis]|uniref:Glycosyltransferase RgtA/B/C/D-like domain-containing protein n=3 Tax=Endobacter medicaginis TaxID=1181271 RepID=A0A839UTG0_9PROT|nr:hypothetical protein [Endobacter medicaginis]MBB3173538.1 hypothetical protein [Endobacter medicaginis]MCX5475373.1 hypothetical protein [Endobacter medicaginis]